MAKEFEIEIDAAGKVTIHPRGVKGKQCTHWADLFARIVGQEESRTMTSEFYEVEQQVHQKQDIRQRRS